MKLLYGVLFLTLAVLLFAIILIGARNPKSARWKADTLVANVYIPLIVAVGIGGLALVVQYALTFDVASLNWREVALSGAVALVGIIVLKALRIKKRLRQFAALEAAEKPVVLEISRPETPLEPPATDRRAA